MQETMQPEEQPKRGRGRPKKIVDTEAEPTTPKRGRGRPKKNPQPEPPMEENLNLFDLDNEQQEQTDILPGFEENIAQNETSSILPGFEEEPYINNPEPIRSSIQASNYFSNNSESSTFLKQSEQNHQTVDIGNLLTRDKKIVAFVGTTKNGTSFLVNNLGELFSSMGINTAILDATKNKNSYYIYTRNEEQLRKVAQNSMNNLSRGIAEGIKVNKSLTVYTTLPDGFEQENYGEVLSTLVKNYSLVLIDCDFDTNITYFENAQEIYLVQSMDILTIQPLTAFLRDLKAKNIIQPEKIRVVVNKESKIRGLSPKVIIGGMSYYNDPSMSFMTEIFNKDNIKYCSIPFDEEVYCKYLEGLVNCKISLNGYTKNFMTSLKQLGNMVYPLLSNKYRPVDNYDRRSKF